MKKRTKTHKHVYAQHPTWETHAYCQVCGFAVVKTTLEKAGIPVALIGPTQS